MRFERRFSIADRPAGGREHRLIETAQGVLAVEAPRGWPAAGIEAWIDWSNDLAEDWPNLAPDGLSPDKPFDTLLNSGPARYARRLAAWGFATGLFDHAPDAEVFADELLASIALGMAAPARRPAAGARVHPIAQDRLPPAREKGVLQLEDVESELRPRSPRRREPRSRRRALRPARLGDPPRRRPRRRRPVRRRSARLRRSPAQPVPRPRRSERATPASPTP